MLRNRSRAMTNKQALMADHGSQSSNSHNCKRPIPSFFISPRFRAFTTKGLADTDVTISPTSILDTKPFSPFGNLFSDDIKSPKLLAENKQYSWEKLDSKRIGLGLVDVLTNNKTIEENSSSTPNNKKVVFGNKLRVQVPSLSFSNLSPTQSPKSPAEFGIKSRNSQSSPSGSTNSDVKTNDNSPRVCTGCLSVAELELSEDYTCVISHGPNPKTTRIFDNCIIESYCSLSAKFNCTPPENNFLSFCYTCKKNLEQKNDIYIYRGEKAFCSQECRYQEMLLDELEN